MLASLHYWYWLSVLPRPRWTMQIKDKGKKEEHFAPVSCCKVGLPDIFAFAAKE